jgi:uncharacterized protein YegJ (DUF2314 family)
MPIKIIRCKMKDKKLKNKKWIKDGFYYDGKDHYNIFKDSKGNVKHVKFKNKLKVCKK